MHKKARKAMEEFLAGWKCRPFRYIRRHERFAYNVLRSFGYDDDDIDQEFLVGCLRAARLWNPMRGSFGAYASKAIKNHFKSLARLNASKRIELEVRLQGRMSSRHDCKSKESDFYRLWNDDGLVLFHRYIKSIERNRFRSPETLPKIREIIQRRLFDQQSVKEVAQAVKVSRCYVHRIIARFRTFAIRCRIDCESQKSDSSRSWNDDDLILFHRYIKSIEGNFCSPETLPKIREIIQRRLFDQQSVKEVAQAVKVSRCYVHRIIARFRKFAIRCRMEGHSSRGIQ